LIPAVAANSSPTTEASAMEKSMMIRTTQMLHPGAVWSGTAFILSALTVRRVRDKSRRARTYR